MNSSRALIITCEHGGNDVPAEYADLFADQPEVLQTHRGYDPGSLEMAERLADTLGARLFFSTTTRLLIELNRSRHHRKLFSEFSRALPAEERARLVAESYEPYRSAVEAEIARRVDAGQSVLHLSIHTFTPQLDSVVRRGDVGFLYDPRRQWDRTFCRNWQRSLRAIRRDLVVRLNYPYLGISDGFTTHLRKRFPADCYAGIELEVNQRWPLGETGAWHALQSSVVESIDAALAAMAVK